MSIKDSRDRQRKQTELVNHTPKQTRYAVDVSLGKGVQSMNQSQRHSEELVNYDPLVRRYIQARDWR